MKRTCLIAIASLILVLPVAAGDKSVKQTIAYVQKLQTNTGGFLSQAPAPNIRIAPTLRATSAAIRALHYLGGDVKDKNACIKFVESCWDPQAGAFTDVPGGRPGVFETAVGLMAIVELKMPVEKYRAGASKYLGENAKTFEEIRIAAAGFEAIKAKSPHAKAWTEDILKMRNKEDGTYGNGPGQARDTASAAVTLLRVGVVLANRDAVIKTIKAGQRPNGGWGKADDAAASDLETSYRVLRCFVMLKTRPDSGDGLAAFVATCRNEDGGYGLAPGQPSTVSGTYFASIITHWLNAKP